MNNLLSSLPVYKVNDYKIILVPHQDLANKIIQERKDFNEKFKIDMPIKSLPEVVLVTFKQLAANENRIKKRLHIIGMGQPQVKVEIKDFGSLPTHTIYLNVTSKLPLSNLIKKMKSDAQRLLNLDKDHKANFFNDYYISIARKLKPWQYEQGWLECENRHFTGKFIASKMLLLRKIEGEYRYKPIESFDFENLPVDIKQGELFS